jgi:hypothetical protein
MYKTKNTGGGDTTGLKFFIYGEKINKNKKKINSILPVATYRFYDTKNDWNAGYNETVDQDRQLVIFIKENKDKHIDILSLRVENI